MSAAPDEPTLHDVPFGALDGRTLYALLRLRTDVFVVEQACPYPELDGRDVEPGARHVWLAHDDEPLAYLRVLRDPGASRIGRVVTAPGARHRGLAARLIAHALATTRGPVVLDAQQHLQAWYERFGFAPSGAPFVEDGIPHVPLRLDRPA